MLGWRDRILRRPLGLVLTEADEKDEENQRHFILRKGDTILAGVIAVPQNSQTVRLRQMWVRTDAAGQGHGQFLLGGVEGRLRKDGFVRICLHARLVVKIFYEKCGYTALGHVFEEVGIPHLQMTRQIGK